MSISCDTNSLAQQARTFKQLGPRTLQEIKTYLLALLAGGTMDPNLLAQQARCFKCPTGATLREIETLLWCQYAGGAGGAPPNPPSFSFANLVWNNPPDSVENAASQNTFTGGVVTLSCTQQNNFDYSAIDNTNTNTPISYTGPAVSCNLNLVMTNTAVQYPGSGSITVTVAGVVLNIVSVMPSADGTYNYPFTIPQSSAATVTVFAGISSQPGLTGLTLTAAMTFTP